MAWIESHQELARHPKTRRLARTLSCSLPQAVGHLQFLWWWALDYAPDGDLSAFTDEDIAEAVMWEGDADMCAALTSAGFLDDDRRIHNWADYTGRLVTMRASNRDRKRLSRARHAPVTVTSAPVTGLHNTTQHNTTEPPDPTDQGAPKTALPATKVARSRKTEITEEAITALQAENPDVDVGRLAADYLNWTGSAKHIDKVAALRNQLLMPFKREQFAIRGQQGVVRDFNARRARNGTGNGAAVATIADYLKGRETQEDES